MSSTCFPCALRIFLQNLRFLKAGSWPASLGAFLCSLGVHAFLFQFLAFAPAPQEGVLEVRIVPRSHVGLQNAFQGFGVGRKGIHVRGEGGQDSLKRGAERRFLQGLATEEFVEENYIGAYCTASGRRVWIEDDRPNSGHLFLHDGVTGARRALFRFNRFIYVYGATNESSEPVLGSVTFFSDGSQVDRFLWQQNGTEAWYPCRVP